MSNQLCRCNCVVVALDVVDVVDVVVNVILTMIVAVALSSSKHVS